MKVIIEAKAVATQKHVPWKEPDGTFKKTDVLIDVLVEIKDLKWGVEVSETVKMGCVFPDFPMGNFRAEANMSCYNDKKSGKAMMSYKIVKILK